MAKNIKFDNGYGIPMQARLLLPGDRYGLDGCLTVEGDKPEIEFYDGRYDHEEWLHAEGIHGQFTGGRYYLETFMSIEDGRGLNLHGGVPDWEMSEGAVALVKEWVAENWEQERRNENEMP